MPPIIVFKYSRKMVPNKYLLPTPSRNGLFYLSVNDVEFVLVTTVENIISKYTVREYISDK